MALAAAERRHPFGLLDERAHRRIRSPHLHDSGGIDRRRMGYQWREVVLQRLALRPCAGGLRHHRSGGEGPLPPHLDLPGAQGHPRRRDRAQHGRRRPRRGGQPRLYPLYQCPGAQGLPARRTRRRLHHCPDPFGRRAGASRDAHRRRLQARLRPDVPARGVAPNPRWATFGPANGPATDRRFLDPARTVPFAGAADRLADRQAPGL